MITKTERIHSLDSLRAIMMMLGLVLHSTEIYLVGSNSPWPKDVNATSHFLGYLENIIHMFRMPIFFVMAGFFGALLFYERGAVKMIKNRVSRIVFPFLVFLFILAPIILVCLYYSNGIFAGNANALNDVLAVFSVPEHLIPESTYHLWFLYYLIFITLFTFLLAKLMQKFPKVSTRVKAVSLNILQKPLKRVLWIALITFLLLVLNWELNGPTPLSFAIDYKAFLFYFFFYALGWVLYKSKEVLESFLKYDKVLVLIAIILFTAVFFFYYEIDDIIKGIISSFIISMFVLGITGLFVRYFSNHSKKMRYISDASYWVYLVHIPFTIIIPAWIVSWNLPGIVKFSITLVVTTIICFATYHFLVRSTFIGKFLNGRRY